MNNCYSDNSVLWANFVLLVVESLRNISVKFLSRYPFKTEINANFYFSHHESIETSSCHCKETTWATIIRNIIHVETNLISLHAMYQLCLLEADFFFK